MLCRETWQQWRVTGSVNDVRVLDDSTQRMASLFDLTWRKYSCFSVMLSDHLNQLRCVCGS